MASYTVFGRGEVFEQFMYFFKSKYHENHPYAVALSFFTNKAMNVTVAHGTLIWQIFQKSMAVEILVQCTYIPFENLPLL